MIGLNSFVKIDSSIKPIKKQSTNDEIRTCCFKRCWSVSYDRLVCRTFRIAGSTPNRQAPYTTFLGDSSGQILIEVYNNPPNEVPSYSKLNHLQLHLAFVSDDPPQDKERLLAAGATSVEDLIMEDGTQLCMLRDPWGLAIQFCKRTNPMLR